MFNFFSAYQVFSVIGLKGCSICSHQSLSKYETIEPVLNFLNRKLHWPK